MTVEAENIRPGDYLLTSNGMRQVIENVRKGPLRYVKIVDTTESGETVLTLQPWVMAIVQPPNV
jgi:mannose-6-phosphate isomerase-like protein (cupin superfamily)